ncbi:ATP-binding protein [Desulfurivibrio sp. D14AmB]|uniref:ATP-binding protein n=1 Tax=Desulfurivibrio sp. D14AmB TaxID=3374370 RepID=UPI00376EF78A
MDHLDHKSRIRGPIMLLLGLTLLFSAMVTIFTFHHIHRLHVAREAEQRQQAIQTLLPTLLAQNVSLLEAQLNTLTTCPLFLQAWRAGDREDLLDRISPSFNDFKARYQFINFSLRQADQTLFLQLQHPRGHGDYPAGSILARAVATGTPAHGLELDRSGIIFLRLVHPLYLDDQLAGFLDFSRDLHGLTATIHRTVGSDIWLLTAKENLDRERWRQRPGAADEDEWERFSREVILTSTTNETPPALTAFIDQPHQIHLGGTFTTTIQGWTVQGGQVPLRDQEGQEIAELFFLDDASALVTSLSRLRLLFLSATGVTAGGVFLLLFLILGRTQNRLTDRHRSLLSEIETRQRAEGELRQLKEDLERQVANRTRSINETNQALQREIEQRQEIEEELRDAKEEWERTFDAMEDSVIILDLNLRIIRANRAAGDFLGLPAAELVGRQCHQLYRDASEPCPDCPVVATIGDCRKRTTEIEHCQLDKTLLASAWPISDGDGSCRRLVHVARDITEQKKFATKLQQTRKMEAIGTLAAGVAHDFNNILTGVLGYGELILREAAADSAVAKDIGQIVELGRRGAALTRQLLAFSRQQTVEMRPLDLNELTANLMKSSGRLIGEDIEIKFNPGPNLAPVKADPMQMDQVILNLVVNARDAMPTGGTLTIETANVEIDAAQAERHPGMKPGPHVILAISDTGIGMDREVREHIFEPFFTTKGVGQGTGLGLATVYGIIQQHQGSIWVYSEVGQGTEFKIFLPVTGTPDMPAQITREPDLPRGQETIMVAEDEEILASMIGRTLENLGYTVLTARDPAEAELQLEARPAIDLLLTDMVMPGGNGMELYRRLAARRPGLKVLFMSGYNQAALEQKTMDFAGLPFIQKPFTAGEIARLVRHVLDQQNRLNPGN